MINVRIVVEDKDNELRKKLGVSWPQVAQAGLMALSKIKKVKTSRRKKTR